MSVVVNTSDVSRLLDEAFAAVGHGMGHEDRESWKRNAQAAAQEVQSHPDNSRLVVPPSFEVEVTTEGYTVTPLAGDWSPTMVVVPGTLGTHTFSNQEDEAAWLESVNREEKT